jgi:hypothetical protein
MYIRERNNSYPYTKWPTCGVTKLNKQISVKKKEKLNEKIKLLLAEDRDPMVKNCLNGIYWAYGTE